MTARCQTDDSWTMSITNDLVRRQRSSGTRVATVRPCLLAAVLVRQYALHTPVALPYQVVTALLVLAVLYSHRKNIGRIIAGTENRFSISRKSDD